MSPEIKEANVDRTSISQLNAKIRNLNWLVAEIDIRDIVRVMLRNILFDDKKIRERSTKFKGCNLVKAGLAHGKPEEKMSLVVDSLAQIERLDPELAAEIRGFLKNKNIEVGELNALRRMGYMAREEEPRKAISAITQHFEYFKYVLEKFKDEELAGRLLSPLADVQKANRLIGRKIAFLNGFIEEIKNWGVGFNLMDYKAKIYSFRSYVRRANRFLYDLVRIFADRATEEKIKADNYVKHFLLYWREYDFIRGLEEKEKRGVMEDNWRDFFEFIDEIRKRKEAHDLVDKFGDKPLVRRFTEYWHLYHYWPGRNESEGWRKAFFEIKKDFTSGEHIGEVIDDGRKAIIAILMKEISRLNEMLEGIAKRKQKEIRNMVEDRIKIMRKAPKAIMRITKKIEKRKMGDIGMIRKNIIAKEEIAYVVITDWQTVISQLRKNDPSVFLRNYAKHIDHKGKWVTYFRDLSMMVDANDPNAASYVAALITSIAPIKYASDVSDFYEGNVLSSAQFSSGLFDHGIVLSERAIRVLDGLLLILKKAGLKVPDIKTIDYDGLLKIWGVSAEEAEANFDKMRIDVDRVKQSLSERSVVFSGVGNEGASIGRTENEGVPERVLVRR